MNNPPPAESRGGATAEGLTTPVAAAAHTANIFDSIDRYAGYPIVHDALLKVKHKIEHGTLAGSYDIVDTSRDHKDVLLNLAGEIRHEYFAPEESLTYAEVDPETLDAITFNGDLIEQCQRFYVQQRFPDVGAALRTHEGLSYSAVIQETFEHELAHLKIRRDRVLRRFTDDTPEGPPLHVEAGFGVQRKIRADNEKQEDRLLEVPGDGPERWVAPLGLVWGHLAVDERGLMRSSAQEGVPVTNDELVEHLKYGGINDPTSAGVPQGAAPAVAPVVSRTRRHRDGDDGEDRDGKTPKTPRLSSSTRTRKQVPVRSPAALPSSAPSVPKVVPTLKPEDEEEPLYQLHRSIVAQGNTELFKTMTNATLVDAKFQNEGGLCPDFFSPSDRIYVSLTFHNATSSDVYLRLARKNFPREGILVVIHEGERFPGKIANRLQMVAKKLSPGESYTFTPRKLCAGPKTEDKEEKRRLKSEFVPYWTPAEAGTYTVEFPLWKKKFSFVIREDGDDAGACSKE